jgi:hypothetical protein
MLLSAIVRIVDFCIRHVWSVIVLALFLAATSGAYAVHHFAIDTNVNDLISRDLPWRQRELDYQAAFPQSTQLILVVVDAPTPEETSAATRALASSLSTKPNVFRSVQEQGGGSIFNQNRFLFLPTEQVERSTRALAGAAPIIRVLVKDPSLRGLVQALSYGLEGVKVGQITLDELAKTFLPQPRRHWKTTPPHILTAFPGMLCCKAMRSQAGGAGSLLSFRCSPPANLNPALRRRMRSGARLLTCILRQSFVRTSA